MTAIPARVGPQTDTAELHADTMALEARITQVVRGAARAAVLGVNDGLVSNVCLILAVAGAGASRSSVRLAGFASLVAGALSMAAGEWISVRSQVELFEGILGRLRTLVRRNPELILDQLTDRLESAGIARETAQRVIVGTWMSRDDWKAWHEDPAFKDTRQRLEELQDKPDEMEWFDVAIEAREAKGL